MMQEHNDNRPYRPCVGLMLINADGAIFVGNRIDTPGDHWQMPQGGIDQGESPEQAAWRELQEEVGTNQAELIAESQFWHDYDLPAGLSRRIWGGKYRGQTQKWFAFRFTGEDRDITLTAHTPEFSTWQWVAIDNLVDLIVPFKREIYSRVVDEFTPLITEFSNRP